jgi:hypothetical protein
MADRFTFSAGQATFAACVEVSAAWANAPDRGAAIALSGANLQVQLPGACLQVATSWPPTA